VLTPLVEAQIPDQMKTHDMDRETVIREVMLRASPRSEFATVEQIGGTAVFLCSAPPTRSPAPRSASMAAGRRCDGAGAVHLGHQCAHGQDPGVQGHEISPDVLLASACLPTIFRAVEICDPETGVTDAYWDGGYSGNPALFPLFRKDLPDDIVIVNINPLRRDAVPTTPQDILNRINEISFNSSLLRELRAIAFVKDLIAEGRMERGKMKDVLVHMIADDALMTSLTASTKLLPTPLLLHQLKEAGRVAAGRFLEDSGPSLNREGTVDLQAMLN
jgi:NTE family protein